MKNILVFGMTQNSANNFLRKFATKRNDKRCQSVGRLELLNGDYYKTVSITNDYYRGCRCDIAYVQKGIGEYLLHCMIYPCFVNGYIDIVYFKGD
jgi:hypothetical protein